MPEYLAPGVYVEEVSYRDKSIEGVGTSTAAFLGAARFGPISGTPELLTSFADFNRIYGGLDQLSHEGTRVHNYAAQAVRAFFQEGGSRMYFIRVFAEGQDSGMASAEIQSAQSTRPNLTLLARYPGEHGNMRVTMGIRFGQNILGRSDTTELAHNVLRGVDNYDLIYVQSTVQAADATSAVAKANDAAAALAVSRAARDVAKASLASAKAAFDSAVSTKAADDALKAAKEEVEKAKTALDQAVATEQAKAKELSQAVAAVRLPTGFYWLQRFFDNAKNRDTFQLRSSSIAVEGESWSPTLDNVTADSTCYLVTIEASVAQVGPKNKIVAEQGFKDLRLHPEHPQSLINVFAEHPRSRATELYVPLVAKLSGPSSNDPTAIVQTLLEQKSATGLSKKVVEAEPDATEREQENTANLPPAKNKVVPVSTTTEVDDATGVTTVVEVVKIQNIDASKIITLKVITTTTVRPASIATVLGEAKQVTEIQPSALAFQVSLSGGNDGVRPAAGAYDGAEVLQGDGKTVHKTGLLALEDISNVSIVAAPGSTADFMNNELQAAQIQRLLLAHCERMRYRVAVLDSGDNQQPSEVLKYRAQIDSTHGALYYPWIRTVDPFTGEAVNLPPSGFVAGIYARSDQQVGVHKAPANEVVRLATGFELLLNKGQQDVLNPAGINCFRYFPGRGHVLWGARTVSSDPEWKYVNVRRYMAYLEQSIDQGSQWAVFMGNDQILWAKIKSTIESFLFNEWRSSRLMGSKPEEAYFVKCDNTTMTQNDIDNGRLICQIGVSPIKPAEFVVFRIGQWTASR